MHGKIGGEERVDSDHQGGWSAQELEARIRAGSPKRSRDRSIELPYKNNCWRVGFLSRFSSKWRFPMHDFLEVVRRIRTESPDWERVSRYARGLVALGFSLFAAGCQGGSDVASPAEDSAPILDSTHVTIVFKDRGIEEFEQIGVKITDNSSKLEGREFLVFPIVNPGDSDSLEFYVPYTSEGSGLKVYVTLLLRTRGIEAVKQFNFPVGATSVKFTMPIHPYSIMHGEDSLVGSSSKKALQEIPPLPDGSTLLSKLQGTYLDTNATLNAVSRMVVEPTGRYSITVESFGQYVSSGFLPEAIPQAGKIWVKSDSLVEFWPSFCVSRSVGTIMSECIVNIQKPIFEGADTILGRFRKSR